MNEFRDMEGVKKILDIAISEQAREHDSTFLIGGALGSGKSNFMLDCIDYIDSKKGVLTSIKNVALDMPPFITALASSGKGAVVVLDEGRDLAAINHADKMNKAIVKAFEVMRKRAYITFICFSNPSRMQGYYKEDRVKGLFFITKRGSVWYFSSFQLIKILDEFTRLKSKSIHNFAKFDPRFKDTYPVYNGRLKEDYDKLKDETITQILDDLNEEFGVSEDVNKDYLTTKAVAKELGYSFATSIIRLVKRGELKPVSRNLKGAYFFTKEDVDAFKEKLRNKFEKKGKKKFNILLDEDSDDSKATLTHIRGGEE